MVSETVKQNKERQDEYLRGCDNCPSISKLCDRCQGKIEAHRESLIDLRDYIAKLTLAGFNYYAVKKEEIYYFSTEIEELNKMIKKYGKV